MDDVIATYIQHTRLSLFFPSPSLFIWCDEEKELKLEKRKITGVQAEKIAE